VKVGWRLDLVQLPNNEENKFLTCSISMYEYVPRGGELVIAHVSILFPRSLPPKPFPGSCVNREVENSVLQRKVRDDQSSVRSRIN
jgi:hypothetical protein